MGRHIRDNTDAAAQEADDRITEEGTQPALRYEIFGTSTCPYCDKAKELLTKLNKEFVFYNIDEDEQAFDQLVGRIKSWKTVPQIFYGANHIGGYDDLVNARAIWKQSVTPYGNSDLAQGNYVTIAKPTPQNFVFTSANRTIMKIDHEGKLTFGEGLSDDEGSRQGAKLLLEYWLQQRGLKRNDELLEANVKLEERARTAEGLLLKLFETHTMKTAVPQKLITEIEKQLKIKMKTKTVFNARNATFGLSDEC